MIGRSSSKSRVERRSRRSFTAGETDALSAAENFAQIQLPSRPGRPYRRRRSDDADIRIKSANRVGVPAFGAARVEQKIVKIPDDEVVVAFGGAEDFVAGRVDLEEDLAVDEQSEKLDPRKIRAAAEPLDLLRRGQARQGGGDLRIAYLEQRAGARGFQNHRIGAPPQIREPRQDENVIAAKRAAFAANRRGPAAR